MGGRRVRRAYKASWSEGTINVEETYCVLCWAIWKGRVDACCFSHDADAFCQMTVRLGRFGLSWLILVSWKPLNMGGKSATMDTE